MHSREWEKNQPQEFSKSCLTVTSTVFQDYKDIPSKLKAKWLNFVCSTTKKETEGPGECFGFRRVTWKAATFEHVPRKGKNRQRIQASIKAILTMIQKTLDSRSIHHNKTCYMTPSCGRITHTTWVLDQGSARCNGELHLFGKQLLAWSWTLDITDLKHIWSCHT